MQEITGSIQNVIGKSSGIGCRTLNTAGFEFLYTIVSPIGDVDIFLFNVDSNRGISGYYEFCPSYESIEPCANRLVSAPDGTVTGIVSTTSTKSLQSNNNSSQTEIDQMKIANENQRDLESSAKSATPIHATKDPAEIAKIVDALRKIVGK